MRHAPRRTIGTLLSLAFGLTAAAAVGAVTLPPDFVAESVLPGQPFDLPTALAFTPSGRLFVAEKAGRVWAVQGGVRVGPVLDLTARVLSNGDRGLLGLAVSPHFDTDRTLFLYYTADPDSDGVDDEDDAWQRLVRVQISAADSNTVDPASNVVLFGASWADGVPDGAAAHGGGAIRFGRDGTLLVTTGDGAHYASADAGGIDAAMFAPGRVPAAEDLGAFRANDPGSLAGKVLRIDPVTGGGLPSNPWFDGDPASKRSRVWTTGLRNPFRAALRPGTGALSAAGGDPGTLFVGDVGWQTWEDLHVIAAPGVHAGWPCHEGPAGNMAYGLATPAQHGCGTLGTPDHAALPSAPAMTLHHTAASLSQPPGVTANSIIAGEFYRGDRYPSAYWGALFMSDFGQGWIRVATFDAAHAVTHWQPFAEGAGGAVDFATHPVTRDLHYLAIFSGELVRLRYTGPQPNRAPIAVASAAPRVGVRPVTLAFSSAGSSDPDMDPITASWSFGDGTGASGETASHLYAYAGRREVVLTSDDGQGGVGRDTAVVIVTANGAFPTTPVRDAFTRADGALAGSWIGATDGLAVAGGAAAWTGGMPLALWPEVFGAEQEAFARLPVASGAVTLVLKAQAADTSAARLEVRWDAAAQRLAVRSREAGAPWVEHGARTGVVLAAGDTLGARAYSNGIVVVHRGQAGIDTVDASAWPHAGLGGRAGFALAGSGAARLDDWGGGDAVIDPDGPPLVTITSPADSSFFVVGDTLRLRGTASDAESPPEALAWRWSVDLRHNNHTHPQIATTTATTLDLVAEDHDDGTGVWYVMRLAVTDPEQHTTTRTIHVFPEVDLSPDGLAVAPETLGTSGQAVATFWLHNRGREPAPRTRWRLTQSATTLAEGDTAVAGLDSVRVTARFATSFAPGTVTLRVRVDTLQQVVETDELQQVVLRVMPVVPGATRDVLPPRFAEPPVATPAANTAHVRWRTDEPVRGVVRYGLTPQLGDSLGPSDLGQDAIQVVSGLPLGTHVYFRVVVRDTVGLVAVAALDSFTTQSSVVGAEPALPARLALSLAHPNPSRGAVTFTLDLPRAGPVSVRIMDVAGRELWQESQSRAAGRHTLLWPGSAPAGLYLARVQAGGSTMTRRVVRVR